MDWSTVLLSVVAALAGAAAKAAFDRSPTRLGAHNLHQLTDLAERVAPDLDAQEFLLSHVRCEIELARQRRAHPAVLPVEAVSILGGLIGTVFLLMNGLEKASSAGSTWGGMIWLIWLPLLSWLAVALPTATIMRRWHARIDGLFFGGFHDVVKSLRVRAYATGATIQIVVFALGLFDWAMVATRSHVYRDIGFDMLIWLALVVALIPEVRSGRPDLLRLHLADATGTARRAAQVLRRCARGYRDAWRLRKIVRAFERRGRILGTPREQPKRPNASRRQ